MKNWREKLNNRGLTLVELIVVLVILAILVSILVPFLSGYIDKTQETIAFSECRDLVLSAQTIISEEYAEVPLSDISILGYFPQIKKLAGFTGELKLVYLNSGRSVRKLTCVASNGLTVTYENKMYYLGETPSLIPLAGLSEEEIVEAAKINMITITNALQEMMEEVFAELSETYGEEALYHNQSFVVLNFNADEHNNGFTGSELLFRFYSADGKPVILKKDGVEINYQDYVNEMLYDSGLFNSGETMFQQCKIHFENAGLKHKNLYTMTITYCEIKVFDVGTDKIYYYEPSTGVFGTDKPDY